MSKSFNPSVAILILNYNQYEITNECVQAILRSNYNNFKILLLDNGSHSSEDYDKLMTLQSERCNIFRIEKNRGYVGGMNFLLELASQQEFNLFLIMNNDTVIASDALTALVRCSQKFHYQCIVTGKVYHFGQPKLLQHIGYKFTNKKYLKMKRMVVNQIDNGQWNQEMEMDMIDDIFWLLPDQLYRIIGGYSTFFWFNAEQADLALRAVKIGFKLIYTPEAKLWHKGSMSMGGRINSPRLVFYNTQGSLILYYLHLTFFRFFIVLVQAFIRVIKDSLINIVRLVLGKENKFILIYADFRAILWVLLWIIKKNENTGKTPFDNEVKK
jgi:GT2 family glycosyltransferase